MESGFDNLSEKEKALVAIRAKADYVISCAIDWISRFHAQFPGPLISNLLQGIRELTHTMHERSAKKIESRISDLLEIQSRMLLPASQHASNYKPYERSFPTADIPRVHEEWHFSEDRFARGNDEVIKARKGLPVFVSYARADSAYLSKLLVHLRPLERSGRIELWHDGKLIPGRPWKADLDRALMQASVAVLIVTANFMASDFIYTSELPPLTKRARNEGVSVFPVVFGHCLFDEDPHLAELQLFNDPEYPLSHLSPAEADATLVKLAKAIRERT